MKNMRKSTIYTTIIAALAVLSMNACTTTNEGIDTDFTVPDGIFNEDKSANVFESEGNTEDEFVMDLGNPQDEKRGEEAPTDPDVEQTTTPYVSEGNSQDNTNAIAPMENIPAETPALVTEPEVDNSLLSAREISMNASDYLIFDRTVTLMRQGMYNDSVHKIADYECVGLSANVKTNIGYESHLIPETGEQYIMYCENGKVWACINPTEDLMEYKPTDRTPVYDLRSFKTVSDVIRFGVGDEIFDLTCQEGSDIYAYGKGHYSYPGFEDSFDGLADVGVCYDQEGRPTRISIVLTRVEGENYLKLVVNYDIYMYGDLNPGSPF